MYETICPSCGRGYRDVDNRLAIAGNLKCIICLLEEELDRLRWETDGGH